ncbi:aldehyde ferredoxin oxidoreductase C-terminal domain-containing protein [Desulfoscipio gibsoniae]|uniref:Aldehyde:ferredoxin oxidoreductase n=1 Tax=Desulfoscipio gibsoniae DSM 7213 TaxID=767817 RepID=R4KKD4_9FIRM|nr:aldehyde ferredoxin oxidoreductase C-terminal domain-containing protein [Desulfoscipio gibsoniae]AGL00086.1 aldehyde:ferredoxin oxidoreductase [Desulfoscipio gibsoniae DSM 7213]
MKFIRVNTLTNEITEAAAASEYADLGGRGLTSSIISKEVHPRAYALGADNKLVLAPGLLTGTSAPCSGRLSVGAKSPLTGTIKESNVGGLAGQYLAGHGITALIFEGKPEREKCRILVISQNEIKLEDKNSLRGLGNYAVVEELQREYGSQNVILSVGPAGEMGAAVASIAGTDMEGRPSRHAGRGGLGSVLASKGIKAIVIAKPANPFVEAANARQFKESAMEFARSLNESKKALRNYGTAVLVNSVNGVGGLPTRNFSTGHNEEALHFCGERLHELCQERGGATGHPCSRGCAIRCSNVYHDEDGNYVTSGLEFETIVLLGSNCGLNNLDEIAKLDRLCDDLGIDTMEMGVTLGVTMEAGLMPFGDYTMMCEAIESVAKGTQLGKVLGQGATVTGKILGVERVPAVKGQGMSAYDPRALKGTGVTYATSTMGADHTSGNALPGRGGLDCHKPDGQVKLSQELQTMTMVCDMLGICIFVGPLPENMPVMTTLFNSFGDRQAVPEDLMAMANKILSIETRFNHAAGITQNDLPRFFRTEPLPNNNLVFDVDEEELKQINFYC